MPQYYNECQGCERIAPDLLNAFKENPFTHSLSSAV
jgi:predicted nucleic acid-binding Zn ribbon protein